jgi:hypothetical protein
VGCSAKAEHSGSRLTDKSDSLGLNVIGNKLLLAMLLLVAPVVANARTGTMSDDRPANAAIGTGDTSKTVSANQIDDLFTITKQQAPSAMHAFFRQPNGASVNVFQAMTLNGSVIASTNVNFLATATPDNVTFSGWGIRGGKGTNPLVVTNFGSWFENNTQIVWTQELDVNNEGATQPEGSDSGGIGLAVHTGSTYSPDTAIAVRRMQGAGSGPGFLRGMVIEGARNVGLRIIAMDPKTYPELLPAAPGTLTALQVAKSSDVNPRFTMDESGAMTWGTGATTPDVSLRRTGPDELTVEGSINDTAPWLDHHPQCKALSGSLRRVSARTRFSRFGKRVFFNLNIHIEDNGSAAGAIHCDLPVPTNDMLLQTASGRRVGRQRNALIATMASGSITITDYRNAYPASNGAILAISGTYEAQ